MTPAASQDVLRIHRIAEDTAAEGFGRRMCVWVQGCSIRCPGCMAKDTWDRSGGTEVSLKELISILEKSAGQIEGITLLGGEPFDQAFPLCRFASAARNRGLSVIAFSGYTLSQLRRDPRPGVQELLAQTDLLIDGPFIAEQRSFTRPWAGSGNQQYRFLSGRYTQEDLEKERNRVEIRLQPDGNLRINGMADFPGLLEALLNPTCGERRSPAVSKPETESDNTIKRDKTP